jgi:hypothetical protein
MKTCVRKLFYNFESDPTVGSKDQIKSYGPCVSVLWSGATSLFLTEKRFHIYFKENSVWKLFNSLKGNSTVGSKVRVLSKRYSGLLRRDLHFTE